MPSLTEVTPDGRLSVNFHGGQLRAWDSERRFVVILAGTQSGKTVFGPLWLWREIQRRGPGDYLIVTPTFQLLELKALPEFRNLFERTLQLGTYTGSPSRRFAFSPDGAFRTFGHVPEGETKVLFGYAGNPDSLESATAKAAWLDEAGQKEFKLGSWEAIGRRLSIHQGRILVTTTPYNLGWLKQKLWDRWQAGDPDIDVIRFDSTENPAFPPEEFERARLGLPKWKFDLFYKALFTRPAGLIYDAFNEEACKCPRFELPSHWQRYLGLDFGGVNTAGIFFAKEPSTGRLFAYREYKAGGLTAKGHAQALLRGEPQIPLCVGGAKSEGQWRAEFAAAGLPVLEPKVTEVEVGIDRVYGGHLKGQVMVFADLAGYLEEKLTYSRKTDDAGNVTEEIEDKHSFHFMDAERYILSYVLTTAPPIIHRRPTADSLNVAARAPAGVFHQEGKPGDILIYGEKRQTGPLDKRW